MANFHSLSNSFLIPPSAQPSLGQTCTYSGCVVEYDEPGFYHYFMNATCIGLEPTTTTGMREGGNERGTDAGGMREGWGGV